MKRTTTALLRRLEEAPWFSTVGQPLGSPLDQSVLSVNAWKEALRCCKSTKWSDFTLEQQNELTMFLHHNAHDRYQNWNKIVVAVKKEMKPILKKTAVAALKPFSLEVEDIKAIQDDLSWNVLGACMELEYGDVREPAFFCGLTCWYLSGRFPCGWAERNAKGKIALLGPVEDSEYDPNEPDWLKLVLANQERLFNPKVRMPKKGKLVVF
jgi:hypothetical protein